MANNRFQRILDGVRKGDDYVASPCTALCQLDHNDVCMGCNRSSEEIVNWMQKSKTQKIEIIKRLQLLESSIVK